MSIFLKKEMIKIKRLKYSKILNIGFKNSVEYRVDFLLSLVSCFFPIVIQYYLWQAIFKNSGKSELFGYNYSQMLIYVILSALITKLISTNFEGEINEDIKNGGLSRYLIQPVNYFFYRLFKFLGEKLLHLIIVFSLIIVFLFSFKFSSQVSITLTQILLFILIIILDLVLKFLLSYTISVIAFWMEECWGLFLAINVVATIISGGIFPIDIFGNKVLYLLKALPFYYLTYFPINILNGRAQIDDIVIGLTVQLTWILILILLQKYLWKNGMKKYIAAGC